MSTAKKIKVGDVVEMTCAGGYCYGLVTHIPTRYPHFITIYREIHSVQQSDTSKILKDNIRFRKLYFAQAALKSGLIKVVDNVVIPRALKKIPKFKNLAPPEWTKGVYSWSIFDLDDGSEFVVKKLSRKQNLLPLLQMIGHDVLIQNIEGGWSEGDDPFSIYPDVKFC